MNFDAKADGTDGMSGTGRRAGFADIGWPRGRVIYATKVTLTRRLITLSYQMSEGFCRQGLSMTLLQVQILPIGKEQLTTSSPKHYLQHSLHEHRAPHVPKVPRKGRVTEPSTQQRKDINQRRHHWPRILLLGLIQNRSHHGFQLLSEGD